MAACCLFLLAGGTPAKAVIGGSTVLEDGTVQTTYMVGPITVTSGQNRIDYKVMMGTERPSVDGWITRIEPNLVYTDGTIPKSSKIMFHHGVWLNQSRNDATTGGPERFYATGEEKTIMELPPGYGYRYKKTDLWILNHMIHNLVPQPADVYITYKINFIPDSLPQAASIKPVRPIWMDIDNGSIYPVFDVHRGEGGADGEFTYPQDAKPSPYGSWKKNEWTVDRDGVLLQTTGHVHTGGLSTNLYLRRDGASYQGPTCDAPQSFAAQLKKVAKAIKNLNAKQRRLKKKIAPKKMRQLRKSGKAKKMSRLKKATRKQLKRVGKTKKAKLKQQKAIKAKDKAARDAHQACVDSIPSVEGNRVHLFESDAHYFEPAGPVSWDVAMRSTRPDWRVAVKAGDVLELQTTYETKLASWYESMGINVVYMADDETDGDNPYETKVDKLGVLNHGHYEENDDHGGGTPLVASDPTTLADGPLGAGPFTISGYSYGAATMLPGGAGKPPVVEKGDSLTFNMSGSDLGNEIWHSLTSCKSPCNKSTGIAYPIADGDFQFDSGQMGNIGAPTVGRTTWSTPADLPVGTHTFFCRIHPLMRGAVRVVEPR